MKQTIWITKYALTTGIIKVEAKIDGDYGLAGYVPEGTTYIDYVHPREWCATRTEALVRAEEMRQKRLKSLEKQIKKITNLKFKAEQRGASDA